MFNKLTIMIIISLAMCLATFAQEAANEPKEPVLPSFILNKIEKAKLIDNANSQNSRLADSILATGPNSFEIFHDCNKATKRLSDVINSNKAPSLMVHLTGTCNENVLIMRDFVSIVGPDNGYAFIVSNPAAEMPYIKLPYTAAVSAVGANAVELKNINLTGGAVGLQLLESSAVQANNVVIHDVPEHAIYAQHSNLNMSNSKLRNAAEAAYGVSQTIFNFKDSLMENFSRDGAWVLANSQMTFDGITFSNAAWGPQAYENSSMYIYNSNINVVTGQYTGVYMGRNSFGAFNNTSISADVFEVYDNGYATFSLASLNVPEIYAENNSLLYLSGSQIQCNNIETFRDSYTEIRRYIDSEGNIVQSNLTGDFYLDRFSRGYWNSTNQAQGTAECRENGEGIFYGPGFSGGIVGCPGY